MVSGQEFERVPEPPRAPDSTPEAVAAIHEASLELVRVRKLWPRVNSVSSKLTRELEENDFSGRFRRALGAIPHAG